MRIDVTKVYKDLKGDPLSLNGIVWTMGEVLKQALLASPADPNKPYSAEEHKARLELARKVDSALAVSPQGGESEVEFPIERVVQLKADVCRLFGPILAGQAVVDLDG